MNKYFAHLESNYLFQSSKCFKISLLSEIDLKISCLMQMTEFPNKNTKLIKHKIMMKDLFQNDKINK